MISRQWNIAALRWDRLLVSLIFIALLAQACSPSPTGAPLATDKPGADVDMELLVSPDQPAVGDQLALQINATARAAVVGARIELVLPANLKLTGEPIQWAGDLRVGDQVSLKTTAQVISLPMVEPIQAILWIGQTPHNTAVWPVATGSSKPQRPADLTLEYEQAASGLILKATIMPLIDISRARGTFILPDGFSAAAGSDVWAGALLANEAQVLTMTAQVDGQPRGQVVFRLETFGAGTLETQIALDDLATQQQVAKDAVTPHGHALGSDREQPIHPGTDAKAEPGGAAMQSSGTPAADITIVAGPSQPALNEAFVLSAYILPNADLGETVVEIGVPEGFAVLNGETSWRGNLSADQPVKLSADLSRTAEVGGEIQVSVLAADGTVITNSRWVGPARAAAPPSSDGPSAQAGTLYLGGRFVYDEDLTVTRGAYWVGVDVYDYDETDADDWICSATTNSDGYWSCNGTAEDALTDDTLEVYAVVFAYNSWYGAVRTNLGAVYAYSTPDAYLPESGTTFNFGTWWPPADPHYWDGAWHIHKMLAFGNQLSEYQGGDVPPNSSQAGFLNVYWPSLDCGTSCYDSAQMWLLGPPNADSDEWDEAVVLHEYGHYIMDMFADMDPPAVNYCHDAGETPPCGHSFGSHEDPATAYIEGWANYFEAATRRYEGMPDPHLYTDNYGAGTITNNFETDCASHSPASTWNDNEGSVTCILWDINDAANDDQNTDGRGDAIDRGHEEVHTVFSHYDPAGAGTTPWTIDEFYTGFTSAYAADNNAVTNIYFENGIDKGAGSDSFESDDLPANAKWILPAVPQTHSISPATDVDWVKFTLTTASNVTLRTTGTLGLGRDTRMYLYGTSSTPLGSSDDEGPEQYSLIRMCGANKLPAGTYYVAIDEFGNNNVIPSYRLSLSRTCDPVPSDFSMSGDNAPDGTSEVVVYRNGAWLLHNFMTGTLTSSAWTGNPGGACIPAPMDFDGDGAIEYTQLCSGAWNFYGDTGTFIKGIWVGNIAGLRPVPADYDGDGTDDVVVFNAGAWNRYDFATGAAIGGVWTGNPGGAGRPIAMDYNGDGSADRTIVSGGAWHFYNANGSYNKGIWVGNVAGQLPVPGDYNGDGTDDPWVFRSGAWLPYDFATGAYLSASSVWTGNPAPPAGGGATKPAPLDYDGDGTLDFTFFGGGPWHFYNDNGSYNKGVWVGRNTADVPISHRPLP